MIAGKGTHEVYKSPKYEISKLLLWLLTLDGRKSGTEIARGSYEARAPVRGCMLICLEIFIYAYIDGVLDE